MSVTFQKAYKLTLGQFNTTDTFNVLTTIEQLRFTANISVTAKNGTTITPEVSTIKIFNLPPETISTLTSSDDLYLEVKAGYLYENGKFNATEDLPIVYFGSVVFIQTQNNALDLITTFHCTPMHGKGSRAKANRVFTKGTKVREVFDYLAETMNSAIAHDWEKVGDLILEGDKTLTGGSAKLIQDWAERFQLRVCHESSSVLRIIDKSVRDTGKQLHEIPLSNAKGYPEIVLDVSKVLKEGTTKTPDINVNTFLFPKIEINDTIRVELIDYTVPQVLGEYQTNYQDFIVNQYTHMLDSHEGGSNSWTTSIQGKGAQK